jgi:hypothetical protein
MVWPANLAAGARGQAPPVVLVDDGVTDVRDPEFPLAWLAPIPAASGYDPFRAPGWPRPALLAVAWTIRPTGKDGDGFGPALTGTHGVITRQPGWPVGQQEPQGGAQRAVFRPIPEAWDSGYVTGLPPA